MAKLNYMFILKWLLVGLIAGSLAKMITPQDEKGGWLSSLGIGIVGSIVGGFIAGLIGLNSYRLLAEILIAFLGSVVVLYIYHRYMASKS